MISIKLNVLDNGELIVDKVYNQDREGSLEDITPQSFEVNEEEAAAIGSNVIRDNSLRLAGDLQQRPYDTVNEVTTTKLNIIVARAKHTLAAKRLARPIQNAFYKYQPHDRFELEMIMNSIIEKEGWEANLNVIDVSRVTNFSGLFADVTKCKENKIRFNLSRQDIDVSSNFHRDEIYSKYNFAKFNGDISKWDTSNATDMSRMFVYSSGDLDVSNWNTSKVTTMSEMFYDSSGSTSLHVANWDVSNVEDFSGMFRCENIPLDNKVPDLSKWNMSKAVDLSSMFLNCKTFKGTGLANWNISNVTNLESMFSNCELFNEPIGSWNTSKVNSCDNLFSSCKTFNQNLSGWDVSNVGSMSKMFSGTAFNNSSIKQWDVSHCAEFSGMFKDNAVFNVDISGWNMREASSCRFMFKNAKSFKQDLSEWRFLDGMVFYYSDNMFENCPTSFDMSHWADETKVPRARRDYEKDDLEALLKGSNIQSPLWLLKACGKAPRTRKQKVAPVTTEPAENITEENSDELIEKILRKQKMSEDIKNIFLRF